MSSIATSGVVPSETVGNIAEGTNSTLVQKPHKNIQDYESDSESDTSTDIEDDSSDDDKRLADNPILKERLKQLDRYATPIKHHTHSPVQIIDQHSIPGIYATNVPPDNTPNNGSLSIHGKSSGPSELMDSSLTPPEYRSRQFSAAESPTPCSSSASLSTSITSKHNLSPPNTILGTSTNVSGPILQHEIPDVSVYAHSSNSLSYSEKKYQCQWPNCQRRFCTEETLNLHHSKHTGEKPFNCSLCLYNCYDKPSLNEHYQVNHAKDANFAYNFKDLIHRIPSTTTHSSQHLSETHGYRGSCGEGDTRAFVARTSTPVSTVRHRMADILDSCTPDIPGPLDAEINGILDSLDKESDLPDLFGNGTLEMNRSGAEQNFTNNTNLNSIIQASPYRQNSQSSCLAATLPPSSSVNSVNAESGTSESSLTSLLPNILSELQRAELSGSNEEFEKVKSHVLSVLPTFVIGDKLSTQINEIVDEVNDALLDQPLHVIRAAFYTTRPFNREELYMIDLLEQQMLSESSLTAPNPPRRRGRRPKLQQQLQPYLQRIFSLESGAAESMASQLVNASQKEKYINHYGYYNRSTGFGRGRGRGKSGKHPLSNVKPPSDGLMSKNNPYSQSVYHNSEGLNMCSNGVVKRGRTDSCTQGEYCIEQISDDMPSSNFPNDINSAEQYHTRPGVMHALNHPNDLRTTHTSMFLNSCNYSSARFHCPSEMNRLDMSRISRNSNDDELNESEDGTPTIITTNNYNSNNMTHQFMYNQSRTLTDHEDHKGRDYDMQNDTQNNHNNSNRKNSSHNEKDFMNQDTIGEMLEDLGVIVQKIGERAVARKHQHHAEGQPLNLSDFGGGGRQPCDSMNNRQFFNRNEANSHSIQLPSMATLASGGSVDTPPSVEENSSIPGSVSNPETPHLSTASYHALSSLKSFNAYSQIGISLADGTKNTVPGSTSASISNTSQAGYNSLTNNYHRTAPIWSCESMCFSSTRGDELRKSDQTHITNNNFNPQTRNSQSTRDYSNKPNGDMNQSYYPKDLSTRVQSFGSRSDSTIHQSQHSPKDFTRSESNDPNFNDIISGSLMNHHPAHLPPKDSSGSQISTAEAVDHLRSLSALGAKYTACLEMQEESRYQSNQRLFPEDYAYNQSQIHSSDASLRRNPTEQGGGESLFSSQMSHNSGRIPTSNILGYNMPSALNNLLYSGQKPNEYAVSLSRLTGNGSSRDNPMNADITTTMAAPTNCASGSSNSSSSSSNTTHNDADSSSAVRSSGFGNHNSDAFGTLRNYSSAASVAAAYHQQLSSPRCAINNNNSNSNNSMNRSDLSGHNSYASNPTPSSSGSSSSSSASGSLTHSSSTASSSSPPLSVRSSLQELYQHHHHQQQQQQSTVRPPIQEVTTRQLLSEAAATAVYAHGLGRCDGQGFNGLPVIPSGQQGDNTDALQRSNNQYTGFPFSSNQYRYQSFDNNQYTTTQSSVSVSNNRLVSEQQLSHNNNSSTTEYSSNSNYVEHNPDGRSTTTPTTIANTNTSLRDNYSLYPSHHLRQGSAAMQNTLGNSRSMVEHAQANNTATASQQLAHSIHEVSGLAAAYAYHQYHHQQQQQHQQAQVTPTNRQHQLPQPQAIPQPPPPPSAHTHYQNLLGQTNRPYNTTGTGQLDEENLSSHQHSRELTVPHHNNNNNTHPVHSSERHDPKSAYLAETYRNAQHITTTPGRFFF
uniref:C2H2-type domain-containing protein n=1 Tax=Trichobilharzia regenti TaxID=157069 RepID=A0AA85IMF6_TRIRE|nr:unnamed protein product [Trichobilharzia regenti]